MFGIGRNKKDEQDASYWKDQYETQLENKHKIIDYLVAIGKFDDCMRWCIDNANRKTSEYMSEKEVTELMEEEKDENVDDIMLVD